MVIKLGKRKYFKPRVCPECGKVCLFGPSHLSIHCKVCSKRIHHRKKRQTKKAKNREMGMSQNGKYNAKYKRARKKIIEAHPYCALCGSTENLTAHHVGGGHSNAKLTVLCYECHQAYEKYNERRNKCAIKRGTKKL